MNWQNIETNWESYKDSAKHTWSRLHEAELEVVGGNREKLINKVCDKYSMPRDEAELEIDTWALAQSDNAVV